MKKYSIICSSPDGRVIAHLNLDGELTIHHDHFCDEDNIDMSVILNALDRWSNKRTISHLSKKGLNLKTVEQVNDMQEQGDYFDFSASFITEETNGL